MKYEVIGSKGYGQDTKMPICHERVQLYAYMHVRRELLAFTFALELKIELYLWIKHWFGIVYYGIRWSWGIHSSV